jgi:hypothetical protein
MLARLEFADRMHDVLGLASVLDVEQQKWKEINRSFMAGRLIKVRRLSADGGDFDIEII